MKIIKESKGLIQTPCNAVHKNLRVYIIINGTEWVCLPKKKCQEGKSPWKLHILNGLTISHQTGFYPTYRLIQGLKVTKVCVQNTEKSMRMWSNRWPCK